MRRKRNGLARILLRLAHLETLEPCETAIPIISQGILAQMVGTTRSRVCFFMKGFEHSGFIDYILASKEVRVRPSLLDFCAEYTLPLPLVHQAPQKRSARLH
jgi:hypothetical protein